MRPAASRGVLDRVSRASEILFGLIMALTFTLSLAAAEAGRPDMRAVLIGMLSNAVATLFSPHDLVAIERLKVFRHPIRDPLPLDRHSRTSP